MSNVYRAVVDGLVKLVEVVRGSQQRQVSRMIEELALQVEVVRQAVEANGLTLGDVLNKEAEALDIYLYQNDADKSESLRKAIIWKTIAKEMVRSS